MVARAASDTLHVVVDHVLLLNVHATEEGCVHKGEKILRILGIMVCGVGPIVVAHTVLVDHVVTNLLVVDYVVTNLRVVEAVRALSFDTLHAVVAVHVIVTSVHAVVVVHALASCNHHAIRAIRVLIIVVVDIRLLALMYLVDCYYFF